jgi:hypothetical protein
VSRRNIAPSPPKPRDGDAAGRAGASQGSRPTLPLVSQPKASPFWVMKIGTSTHTKHDVIDRGLGREFQAMLVGVAHQVSDDSHWIGLDGLCNGEKFDDI